MPGIPCGSRGIATLTGDLADFDHARAETGGPRAAVRHRRGPGPRRSAGHPGPGGPLVRRDRRRAAGRRAEDVLTTTFDLGHDELVLVKDIEVWSICEHHLVPFTGVAHVGYIPGTDGRITGLSKLARLVDVYAKRPQVQERLTTQVAESLMEILQAARRDRGDRVRAPLHDDARRPQSRAPRRSPRAVRGQLRDPVTRAEAMSLIVG